MENKEGWTIGPVMDELHPQNRSQTVPGRGCPGPTKKLGILHGLGISEGVDGEGVYGLPT